MRRNYEGVEVMVCFEPLNAYLPFNEDSEGKRRLIFSPKIVNNMVSMSDISKKISFTKGDYFIEGTGYDDSRIIVSPDFHFSGELNGVITRIPCGKCIGCRNDNARRWSARCYNEAQYVGLKNCCFVTLTFNNKMLYSREHPWSLDKKAFSGFIKRLRSRIKDKYGIDGVRFFSCGEYGSLKGRPHYHMLIFGFNFPDKQVMKGPKYPKKLQPHTILGRTIFNYTSDFLNSCWSPAGSDESFGFATISDLTYEDCAYTARYVLKKLGNFEKSNNRESEFINASRMPGLGYDFFHRYYKNILCAGRIDLGNGRFSDIPRYYVDKLKEFDPEYYEKLKLDRMHNIIYNLFIEEKNPTRQRLMAQEELLNQKLDKYVREYEVDSILHNI
nr:replication initiation protein [Microvirus sp.]CAI9751515.1 replication initiation protein [Microvirus sp.]